VFRSQTRKTRAGGEYNDVFFGGGTHLRTISGGHISRIDAGINRPGDAPQEDNQPDSRNEKTACRLD
jgi:hypothetical protein